MENGTLQIQVIEDNIALPVSDADIKITSQRTGETYTGTTDVDGNSNIFTLPAPSIDNTGDTTADSPFYLYNVEISKPGYNNTIIENVKIFPNQEHYQTLNLLKTENTNSESNITILPDNPIADYPEKIPEDPIKPVPQSSSLFQPFVLKRVIVPEYIIVHDGIPSNTSATNYKVSYKDYLKAVATNEIYSTWNEQAIIANVLAINSFTLNRVFTEWYASNGYNGFTLTSSSSYDQAWAPNKAIPKVISDTVEDYYDSYIKYENNQQPYFSQYWNGSGASRPGWLSQNGSQQLALQGNNYLDILKYYYGGAININTAPVITGLPSSYPGVVMKLGDCSEEIKQMQMQLNAIRKNYPGIPAITNPNGYFDEETLAAVKKFQSVFKLATDGIVGSKTWYQISLVYIAVMGLNKASSTKSVTNSITPTSTSLNKSQLEIGSSGEEVKKLQEDLKALGYYEGEITGNYDALTEEAVKTFQSATSVVVDGKVGPITWTLLEGEYIPASNCFDTQVPPVSDNNIIVTIKSGDTLYSLARDYCTTVDEIKSQNGLTSNTLSLGQVLTITDKCNDDIIENDNVKHIVAAGDTLYSIARKYCTTVDEIKSQNGLTSNTLSLGQVLTITDKCNDDIIGNDNVKHIVVSGDTLYSIARKYCTTVDEIKSQNGLTSNTLSLGQVLTIADKCSNDIEDKNVIHTVVSGDTLYSIARKYCTTVDIIKSLNGIPNNTLSLNQKIIVPDNC